MDSGDVIAVVTAASLGAAGTVSLAQSVAGGIAAQLGRAVPDGLRWVWRALSVVAGGAWGYAVAHDWAGVAVGLGAGTMATAVAAAVQARLARPS